MSAPEQPPANAAAPRKARGSALGSSAPTRKARDPLADRVAFAGVRLGVTLFRSLPAPAARALGRFLGRLAWRGSSRYRNQVLRHMDLAFRDEIPRAQKEAWCKANFEHLGLFLVEFSRMSMLDPKSAAELVDISEAQPLDALLAKHKGVLFCPAHHGNWELAGYSLSLLGYTLKSVARPLDHPQLNEMVMHLRELSGNTIIEKWQVLWKLKKILDGGGLVTMSVDQNGGVAGVFAPLFNTVASTVASPAELHLFTGKPLVVATVNRLPDGIHHKFHIWDVIEHVKTGDHDADRLAVITRINRAYENAVRAYPEQWLWVHRRWKTRPPGEVPGPDGLPPCVT